MGSPMGRAYDLNAPEAVFVFRVREPATTLRYTDAPGKTCVPAGESVMGLNIEIYAVYVVDKLDKVTAAFRPCNTLFGTPRPVIWKKEIDFVGCGHLWVIKAWKEHYDCSTEENEFVTTAWCTVRYRDVVDSTPEPKTTTNEIRSMFNKLRNLEPKELYLAVDNGFNRRGVEQTRLHQELHECLGL